MAFTPLASSNKDRLLNITISKVKDPYLKEWFNETKSQGDTVNSFVVRQLMILAKKHQDEKQQKLIFDKMQSDIFNIDSETKFIAE